VQLQIGPNAEQVQQRRHQVGDRTSRRRRRNCPPRFCYS
jgi:hypothetical protein